MNLENAAVIEFGGARLALLPERAVVNLDSGELYLADLHVGKSATFRANAIPIPEGDTRADLDRLHRAIQRTGVRRVVILGDFLHAPASHLDEVWPAWRQAHTELEVVVVRGNHDAWAGDPRPEWQVELVDAPLVRGELALRHEPIVDPARFVLAGHVHPAIRLRGSGRDRLSLPCFHVANRLLTLPAFTRFSGGYGVRARAGDRVFAIAEEAVMDVTALAA
ncbi:MAG: ligase-associated DNA damage response endonuclease PdeM [Rhodothermales bacterium]|nr:ligase-associated DNA damage response endonuclease PdeM [Rhodothermales bacterium]MBO6779336.1 ligase-associated DNA damage response endonuclease PdeM [Rhodothermales bacterium]